MAIKKSAAEKAVLNVSPDPVDQQGGGAGDGAAVVADDSPASAPAAPADHGAGASHNTTPDGPQPPHTIAVPVGSSGFYSGARPYEDLAAYDARMGTAADTFGDLGWILGTKPKV